MKKTIAASLFLTTIWLPLVSSSAQTAKSCANRDSVNCVPYSSSSSTVPCICKCSPDSPLTSTLNTFVAPKGSCSDVMGLGRTCVEEACATDETSAVAVAKVGVVPPPCSHGCDDYGVIVTTSTSLNGGTSSGDLNINGAPAGCIYAVRTCKPGR